MPLDLANQGRDLRCGCRALEVWGQAGMVPPGARALGRS